jgi:hypothetical protein
VLNGIHDNLTNNTEIHRLNGVKQPIELLSDLKLNSNGSAQHSQERVATKNKSRSRQNLPFRTRIIRDNAIMTDLSRIAPNGDEKTPTTHAVLARSNYNATKNQIQRH